MFAERRGGGVLVGKRVVAMRSPSAKRSCMVSACSIIMFLVLILSGRVDVVFVGACFVARKGVCRGLFGVQRWAVVLLLSFPPTIGLSRVVGLGIEIGWVLVGQARMWCLLWSVRVGVVEVCTWWF